MRKYFILLLATIMTLVFGSGCSNSGTDRTVINISAAISFKDVLNEVKAIYEAKNPGTRLNFNFASSGTLQRQIEQGAPVDLFISAGTGQMDLLLNKGLVNNPRIIAGNELVLILPANLEMTVTNLRQLTGREFGQIAIGDPETVPAGKYAKEALKKAAIWDEIYRKLVMAKDVRQVLIYVETGNVDAGLVYKTDAAVAKKAVVALTVPKQYHSEILYPAAVVKSSEKTVQAEEFLNFMQTEEARAILKKYGFNRY